MLTFSTDLECINEEDDNNNLSSGDTDDVFDNHPEERDTNRDSPSANMLQFTRSLGAINSMSLGVSVLKAKVQSFY